MLNTVINASRTQYPLRLMYALTIYKSHGQTLHKVVIVLGENERSLALKIILIVQA